MQFRNDGVYRSPLAFLPNRCFKFPAWFSALASLHKSRLSVRGWCEFCVCLCQNAYPFFFSLHVRLSTYTVYIFIANKTLANRRCLKARSGSLLCVGTHRAVMTVRTRRVLFVGRVGFSVWNSNWTLRCVLRLSDWHPVKNTYYTLLDRMCVSGRIVQTESKIATEIL